MPKARCSEPVAAPHQTSLPDSDLVSDFQNRLQQALQPDFLIERELGGAGMSRVFVATERALSRKVVVKVLPPELAAGVNVERFRREIQLAAQLQHPHIVPLLAAGDDDGLLWFSMPFIEGESLRGTLTRQKRLSPREVVRILHDVVDALSYAHARGVVHRDIKPDNILTSGMHALVTDFGVAKALSAAIPVHGGTTTGMAIGTPAYMAPEQLAADPAADHRVDLYAVGLLAYELLTGKSPFSGISPQATLAAQLTQMPEPPHRSLSDIPESLSGLIMHCLEKDANKRPASATALLAELEALPPMSSGAAVPVARQRRRPLALVAAAAGVAAVAWAMTSAPWRSPTNSAARSDSAVGRGARQTGGAQRMLIADADSARANGADAETIPVFREITDGAATTTVPLVMTRAESLAIAEAVLKRQKVREPATGAAPDARAASANAPAAAPTGTELKSGTVSGSTSTRVYVRTGEGVMTTIDRDMLIAEVGRIFADSMTKAMLHMDSALSRVPRMMRIEPPRPEGQLTGPRPVQTFTPMLPPPTDGRLRIVVTNYTNSTGRRELTSAARDMAGAVRESIPGDRYDVISSELTERALRLSPDKMSVGWGLRADFVVSGWLIPRGDSMAVVTMLTDVRTGRFSKAAELVVNAAEPARATEFARKQVTAWLDTANTAAARRRKGPSMSLELRR